MSNQALIAEGREAAETLDRIEYEGTAEIVRDLITALEASDAKLSALTAALDQADYYAWWNAGEYGGTTIKDAIDMIRDGDIPVGPYRLERYKSLPNVWVICTAVSADEGFVDDYKTQSFATEAEALNP